MSSTASVGQALVRAAQRLRKDADALDCSTAVSWVYNPLDYAWAAHRQYVLRYAPSQCKVLFLGMNPGPWGMAQTGVPFGEIDAVRNWLQIDAQVGKPDREHPKRPVQGFECSRSEVSGRRLWGLFRERFGLAERFFQHHFVANYCPLVFMEDSGRNLTPDKLPVALREQLESVCDAHLRKIVETLEPQWVIGVGGFAEKCALRVQSQLGDGSLKVGRILHPSPASPAANRDWAGTAIRQLEELGVW